MNLKIKDKVRLMGKKVLVTKVMHRSKIYGGKITWEPKHRRMAVGWITGFSRVYSGDHQPGGYEDPGYIGHAKATPIVFVTLWPTQAPIKVPVDGFSEDLQGMDVNNPYKWPRGGFYDTERKALQDIMKDIPRDKKGRWKT